MPRKDKNAEAKMEYYAMKILDLQDQMKDDAQFPRWSTYELSERADVLKANYSKHEQKCKAKINEKSMNDEELKQFRANMKKIDELYIELKAKLQQRIDELKTNPIEAQSIEASASQQASS